ncbi:MAG: kinase, partial [Eubacterium sp.]|nr:kinase [Eubacterium sp.]
LNEGKDYGKTDFEPIHETLIRIKALSLIIQKYHEHGCLHLDIKPENILILPETKEQMILFDFDSIVRIDDIKQNKAVRLSCSEGYAAPELKQGRLNKICFAADIYEIGALTYFKLFGKTPGLNERKRNVKYDFNGLKLKNSKYQPKLYRRLENFFHKTLSSAVSLRWQNAAEVIEALDELISLSDLSKTFLYDNFIYNTNTFIGREKELAELEEGLEENHAVFIHGIGGIGKSETAKKFLNDNRENFGTILVLNFQGSLKNTILSSDVELGNFSREENENQNDFYRRKFRVLKQVLKEDDIVLLDNFDVESDDELENLFDCKCKFIVTSREDYSDFNYYQIEINEMVSDDDLLDLFYAYNQTEYQEEEQSAVRDIINFVDRHTMTVELIAKHLRISGGSPLEVLEEIKSIEGITELDDTNVKHRKDKRLRAETVEKHLLTLFDLSCFNVGEQTVIKSLSLLGYVKISKEQFSKWCRLEPSDGSVERLVDRGWIKFEDEKIYLHQIILDLVYNHLNPTSESCPAIIESMTEYASEDIQSIIKMSVRRDLMDSFTERIKGSDNIEFKKK